MIRTIEILNYKAIRYGNVALNPFQVMVGPNASGKSTFLGAMLFVRDILSVGIDRAVYGDSRFDVPLRAVNPAELGWKGQGGDIEIALTLELPEHLKSNGKNPHNFCRYEIAVNLEGELSVSRETLLLLREIPAQVRRDELDLFPNPQLSPDAIVMKKNQHTPVGSRKILSRGDAGDYFKSEVSDWNNMFKLPKNKTCLANLPEDHERFPAALWLKQLLMEGTQSIVLNAEAMRTPTPAGVATFYKSDGSNLPMVVHSLMESHKPKFDDWLDHVRTIMPDVAGIGTIQNPDDKSRYLFLEFTSGLKSPSWALSDGTLRLLALTVLAYIPDPPRIMLIEEPENGVHPQAVSAVFDSLSHIYGAQVFCATHSPILLSLTQPEQLLCFSKTDEGAVDIISGKDHPGLREWRETVGLGDLFAAGILS